MKKTIKLFVIALMVGSLTYAQNTREAINNTKQIIEGKKLLERDEAELKGFRAKLGMLKTAVNKDNQAESHDIVGSIWQSGCSNMQSVLFQNHR